MEIADIQVNATIIERFKNLEKTKRLAHAYLFVGSAFIGKSETALAIAKMFCCEGDESQGSDDYFCGTCPACRKIDAGGHPDIHVIDSEFGEQIKIDQVRQLLAQVKLRPFMAPKKIFIVKNAENITMEGSNALLKTLEEPLGDSLLILTTSVPEKNLDTIKSRCHVVRFLSQTQRELAQYVKKYYDEDEHTSQYFAYFSEGCFGKVKRLREKQWFQRKNEIIDGFIFKSWSDDVVKKVLADKEKIKELLDVLLSWMRDSMLIKHSIEEDQLVNIDRQVDLEKFSQKYSFEELVDINNEIVKTCKLLSENLNLKIPISVIKERL